MKTLPKLKIGNPNYATVEGFWPIVDVETDGQNLYEEIQTKERANMFCQCVNAHDGLVNLLKDMLEWLEWDGTLPDSKTRIREALKQAEEADND